MPRNWGSSKIKAIGRSDQDPVSSRRILVAEMRSVASSSPDAHLKRSRAGFHPAPTVDPRRTLGAAARRDDDY